MKLALGTVQFGLNYGAFNAGGQVGSDQAAAILAVAQGAGIDTLDTARGYGTSEAVLGGLKAAERFRIVTKIPALASSQDKLAAVAQHLAESVHTLDCDRLDAVLFHAADDLLGSDAASVWAAAEGARADGRIGQLGVSVYDGEQALEISGRFPVELIQLPLSIFDQRVIASGALEQLKARGIEVHARSVFLQGFALSDPERLPRGLAQFQPELARFRALVEARGTTPLAAALGFALSQSGIDRVVVGVQSAAELEEICAASAVDFDLAGTDGVASSNPNLLNPGLWPANGD
jgi:aryl-alcohol dehydrogenase-like predicted oxidoreductase